MVQLGQLMLSTMVQTCTYNFLTTCIPGTGARALMLSCLPQSRCPRGIIIIYSSSSSRNNNSSSSSRSQMTAQ